MKTEHMEYMLEIARCNSISVAAKNLFIGQTTLSAIISTVENELNIRLFDRTRSGSHPTEEGKRALAIMGEVVAKYRGIQDGSVSPGRKVVRLCAYGSVNTAISAYLDRKFSQRNVLLSIDEVDYPDVVKRIVEGRNKIGIGADLQDNPVWQSEAAHYGLRTQALYTDRYYLVVRCDSPFAVRDAVDVRELFGERIATAHSYPLNFSALYNLFLREFHHFVVFPSNEIIKKAVYRNGDIAVMLGTALHDDIYLANGELKRIPLRGLDAQIVNFLIWDPASELSQEDQALIDFIRAFFSGLPTT